MASLTKISITARKTIRYGIYLIIFLIVGRVFLNTGIKMFKKVFPAPTPAPTVKYGRLSNISFPNSPHIDLAYTLETAEGGFPTGLPTQAKVYFMPKTSAGLLSLDSAISKADALGFDSDMQQSSDTVYKFKNPNYPSTLQMNIVTNTFSISYDLISDNTPINFRPPISDIAVSNFKSYLQGAGMFPEDLDGKTSHDFLKITDGRLDSALSEANFVKINLFRKNYDDLPSMTANPNQANVWAIMSGAPNQSQKIIAAEYHYHPIDESQYSTYPIKTAEEAFSELQNGKAYIANVGLNEDETNLKIRKIYLAYFDPDIVTEYYQPIFVFEGDNGFIAYLPAVTSDYYEVIDATPAPSPTSTAIPTATASATPLSQ